MSWNLTERTLEAEIFNECIFDIKTLLNAQLKQINHCTHF